MKDLLLLHGALGASAQLDPLAEALRSPDGPGHDMTLCCPPGLTRILHLADRERRKAFREIRRDYLGATPKFLAPIRRWVKAHEAQPAR